MRLNIVSILSLSMSWTRGGNDNDVNRSGMTIMTNNSSSDSKFIVKIVGVARNWRDIEFHRFLRAHMKLCLHNIISSFVVVVHVAPPIGMHIEDEFKLVIAISAECAVVDVHFGVR